MAKAELPPDDIRTSSHTHGSRKIVTVWFVDMMDSAALVNELDAESFRPLMERCFNCIGVPRAGQWVLDRSVVRVPIPTTIQAWMSASLELPGVGVGRSRGPGVRLERGAV